MNTKQKEELALYVSNSINTNYGNILSLLTQNVTCKTLNHKHPIIYKEFLREGKHVLKTLCINCGREEELVTNERYNLSSKENAQKVRMLQSPCPNCGSKHHKSAVNNDLNANYISIIKPKITACENYNDGLIAYSCRPILNYENNECQINFEFDFAAYLDKENFIAIQFEKPFLNSIGHEVNICRNNSNNFKDIRAFFVRNNLDEAYSLLPAPNWEARKEEYLEAYDELVESKKKNKRKTKLAIYKEERLNYKAKPLNSQRLKDLLKGKYIYKLYSQEGNKNIYQAACLSCGNIFQFDDDVTRAFDYIRKNVTCPSCKSRFSTNYFNIAILENTSLLENDLLYRFGEIEVNLVDGKIEYTFYEKRRVFVNKKIVILNSLQFNSYDSHSYKHPLDEENIEIPSSEFQIASANGHIRYYGTQVYNTKEELIETINNSCMARTGLLESYGLDSRYEIFNNFPSFEYVERYFENPNAEKLLKAGFHRLLNQSYVTMPKDPTLSLHEILNLPKSKVKYIKKHNPYWGDIASLQTYLKIDSNVDDETLDFLFDNNIFDQQLKKVSEIIPIKLAEVKKYLQSCYNHQCIEFGEATTLWQDYIVMAKRIGIDLSEKNRKFPTSLKKEHDIAVFAYKSIKQEIDEQIFKEQAIINKEYEFEYEDYIAIIPQTPEEIITEATAQHNCLRSYIERVKEGETIVAFVRKKDDPTTSFLTAEIFKNKLIQLKAKYNADLRTKEIVNFAQKWAEKKHFQICC